MAKGRHRKGQQLTVLPTGSKVQTGKAKTANKAAQYSQPLPINVRSPPKPTNRSQKSTSWSQFLLSLIGWAEQEDRKNSRPDIVQARYEPLTQTISIETRDAFSKDDSPEMRLLWECGFFGKGTLSRSEPSWRVRQIQQLKVSKQRARGIRIYTAEELTALRRKERRAAKIERARLAVRAGQQLPDGIIALGGELNEEDEKAIQQDVQRDLDASSSQTYDESQYGKHIPGLIYLKPKEAEQTTGQNDENRKDDMALKEDEFEDVEDMEVLQLSHYEVFFLAGMLGILDVIDENGSKISLEHLYATFLSACLPIKYRIYSPFQTTPMSQIVPTSNLWARPDNPFLIQYVAYHHFRSLGWVVRTGTKFCVDWLLYKKGPAFSHAEFAVTVLPVYEDPNDEVSCPFGPHPTGGKRDWVWFSSINRVNTQVLKTLILCYVIIPPLSRTPAKSFSTPEGFVERLQNGNSYRIREYAIRRFTPQRMRS